MRIAHVITGLEVGGAEMMLLKLLTAMDRTAFEPLVISLVDPGTHGGADRATWGSRWRRSPWAADLPAPGAVLHLVRRLRAFRPDLVQTWMYHADLLGALALPLVRTGSGRPALVWNIRQSDLDPRQTRRGTRLVARLNALALPPGPGPHRLLLRACAGRSISPWVTGSAACASSLTGSTSSRFRPDPRARAALRADLGIAAGAPLVGLVARFDPQKDLPTFLRTAALVRAVPAGLPVPAVRSGDGRRQPATPAAGSRTPGWRDAIHLLGPRADTPRVFAALDLLVSASAYGEGFPNVIGEAMACAVPCVVTDVGDSGLIVGDTGLTVPPRDPPALAAAVLRLLDEGPPGLAAPRQGRPRPHRGQLCPAADRRALRGPLPIVVPRDSLMCGICGVIEPGGLAEPALRHAIGRMNDTLVLGGRTTRGSGSTRRPGSPWGTDDCRSSTSPRSAISRWSPPASATSSSSTARSTTISTCAGPSAMAFPGAGTRTPRSCSPGSPAGVSRRPCPNSTGCSPSPCGTGRSGG